MVTIIHVSHGEMRIKKDLQANAKVRARATVRDRQRLRVRVRSGRDGYPHTSEAERRWVQQDYRDSIVRVWVNLMHYERWRLA